MKDPTRDAHMWSHRGMHRENENAAVGLLMGVFLYKYHPEIHPADIPLEASWVHLDLFYTILVNPIIL